MASRKEEKERLRQAREQAEAADRRQERKRLILGYAVAGFITVAVVAGIVVAIVGGGGGDGSTDAGDNNRLNQTFGGIVPDGVQVDDRESAEAPSDGSAGLEEAAEAANCELLLDLDDEGSTHIDPSSPEPNYKSDPPSSGDHSGEPLADGAFVTAPSPLNYVHTLEHGRVEIQYSSDLPEEDQLQLLGFYDEDRAGMLLFPNDEMPYLVAATGWRNVMGCETYEGAATLDAIRAFRSQFRARGPENIPIS